MTKEENEDLTHEETGDNAAEPEDRGCEVTDGPKQTGPLRGTYFGLPPLK